MNVLVTGGGGFLGRHIIKKCLDRAWRVKSFSRGVYPDLDRWGVETIQADIRDRESVITACKDVDCVIHTAALPGIWGKWEMYHSINVIGTENVIEACRVNQVPKLIYTSSPSVVFGEKEIINGDESLPYPENYLAFYPHTKARAERAIISANGKNGLFSVSIRPHLIWGPGDNHLIPRLIQRAKKRQLVRVGDGSNLVSIAYVENVAEAHVQLAAQLGENPKTAGQIYFINDADPVNLWDWIGNVLKNLELPPIQKSIPLQTAYRVGYLMEKFYSVFKIQSEPKMTRFLACQLATSHYFSTQKAKSDFGFAPIVSPEEGLKRLFAAFQPK